MSKGLDALKRLVRDYDYYDDGIDEERHEEDIEIIEKELKALEVIKKACRKYPTLRATIGIACVSDLNLVLEVLDND